MLVSILVVLRVGDLSSVVDSIVMNILGRQFSKEANVMTLKTFGRECYEDKVFEEKV